MDEKNCRLASLSVAWVLLLVSCSCESREISVIPLPGPTNWCKDLSQCSAVGGQCTLWKRTCDFWNPDLCMGCSCCINCTNQINTVCRDRYAGSCKKSCDETELGIGNCKAGCKCCGCKISQRCLDAGGHCIVGSRGCDGRVTRCCAGKNCYCCIPKICTQSKCCTFSGGRCAKACKKGEVAEEGLCSGDCVCCIEDKCPDSSTCQAYNGRCVQSCEADELSAPWLCGGETCTCCFKKDRCPETLTCAKNGGYCAGTCGAGEFGFRRMCSSDTCLCCMKDKCPDSSTCQAYNGRCVQSCEADELSAPWLCGGETCTCCFKRWINLATAFSRPSAKPMILNRD